MKIIERLQRIPVPETLAEKFEDFAYSRILRIDSSNSALKLELEHDDEMDEETRQAYRRVIDYRQSYRQQFERNAGRCIDFLEGQG